MSFLFPFGWRELVDLLLISFLLHRLFLLFRGTTALQVAVGFLFLWLVSVVAEGAGLVLTNRFFQAMAAVAAVAGIVVFRSEIRAVLLHTNPLRFFLGQPVSRKEVRPEEIASVLFRMAEQRVGALVCLRQRDNPEEFVEAGMELDGLFGGAILESIFARESPVHDGAVVVSDGRIVRMGGILPLTERRGLEEKLGTRHRAALGLSECCDAAVLVVSEERGEVSLAHRGKLERVRDEEELVGRLRELSGRRQRRFSPGGFLAEGARQAAGLAVVFLLVSLLWNLYLGAGHSLVSLRVPVEFRNVPAETVVSHNFGEDFRVRVSGKKPLVESMQPSQISAFIDLSGLAPGTHSVAIDAGNFRLPPGLGIDQIEPGQVEIYLEPRLVREVPVEVAFPEDLPEELRPVSVLVKPGVMRVSGPKSRIEQLEKVMTAPVLVPGEFGEAGEREVVLARLAPLPPFVSLAEGVSREVKVEMVFRREEVEEEPVPEPVHS